MPRQALTEQESKGKFELFPNEVLLKILSNLNIKDLANTTQINTFFKVLAEDDTFWKNRLMTVFHFTHETAESLFAHRNSPSYKSLYAYCKTYELNRFQEAALELLEKAGLTEQHLKGRDWFNSIEHGAALAHLISDCSLLPDEAMAELHSLNQYQALTFLNFYSEGLTTQKLKQLNWLNSKEHLQALEDLVNKSRQEVFAAPQLTINEALNELHGLNADQAVAISAGLSRQEIEGITNKYQIFALVEFHFDGITKEHLIGQDWFNEVKHFEALKYLIRTCQFTIDEAMTELHQQIADDISFKNEITRSCIRNART